MSDLLDLALEGHRGAAIYGARRPLRVKLRLRGNLLALRLRSPFVRPYEVEVDTSRPHARLSPFHRPGRAGVFDGDEVSIEEGGEVVRARAGARAHARGHVRWDELDLLYFLGYALWNYVMTPYYFTWPGFATREIEPWNGQRRLQVDYPDGFPTHCPRQVFYFDEAGRLTRLDYTAEIFGDWTRGAHLCEAHRDFGGLVFPSHRHVRLVDGALRPRMWIPPAMEGWIEGIEVG